MLHVRTAFAAPVIMLLAGCAGAPSVVSTNGRVAADECVIVAIDERGRSATADVDWLMHAADEDRGELNDWCRGVGAPIVADAGGEAVRADSIAVVTWNIHLGAASVDSFVADLRSGALTGRPVEHFVLLVQEATRRDGSVPTRLGADVPAARPGSSADTGPTGDIVATARRLGLRLFYVPSMNNGDRSAGIDRGNAILATVPLKELTAIELPLLAQRRVAVAATIPLLDAAGRSRELRVTSVHLDYGANRTRPLAPFGPGRTLQAGALADALAGSVNSVVGGDFNTWLADRLEGGLTIMRSAFPDFPEGRGEPTHYTAGFWPRRLDHLFLRAGDVSGTAPDRIGDMYGSDHYPLLAWVRLGEPATTSGAVAGAGAMQVGSGVAEMAADAAAADGKSRMQ